jgi:hypothetical protein
LTLGSSLKYCTFSCVIWGGFALERPTPALPLRLVGYKRRKQIRIRVSNRRVESARDVWRGVRVETGSMVACPFFSFLLLKISRGDTCWYASLTVRSVSMWIPPRSYTISMVVVSCRERDRGRIVLPNSEDCSFGWLLVAGADLF